MGGVNVADDFEQIAYSDHRSRYIMIYPYPNNRTYIIVKQGATWNRTPIYQPPQIDWPVGDLVGTVEADRFAKALTLAVNVALAWARDTGERVKD